MLPNGLNAIDKITKGIHTALGKLQTRKNIILIPIKPVPASRPRLSRFGVYYAKNYTDWRNEARKHVAAIEKIYMGALVVVVEITALKPRTSKKLWPKGDVDNLTKGPLDVLTENKGVWKDDDQIVGLWVTKRFTLEDSEVGMAVTIYGEQ